MKKLLLVLAVSAVFVACNSGSESNKEVTKDTTNTTVAPETTTPAPADTTNKMSADTTHKMSADTTHAEHK